MIVYKITNKINGKKYVGQTVRRIEKRWSEHLRSALNLKQSALAKAIRKYGPEAFDIEQIDIAENLEILNKKEAEWIEKEKSMTSQHGYNQKTGGLQAKLDSLTIEKIRQKAINRSATEQTRIKLSEASKKKWRSLEFRQKHALSMAKALNTPAYLAKVSEQSSLVWQRPGFREKMSLLKKDRKFSSNHKENLRASLKKAHKKTFEAWKVDSVRRGRRPSILVYTNIIGIYDNQSDCAVDLNIDPGKLSQSLRGKTGRKTIKGMSFIYAPIFMKDTGV